MRELAGIADAADENRVTHFTWAQRGTPGMRVHLDDHVVMTDSGLVSDTFNTVSRVRFNRSGDPRRVREVMAWYAEEDRPFTWWVGPADYPADLGALLIDSGFRLARTHAAMVADLADLSDLDRAPNGLEIQQVTSIAQLKACATINAAGHSPPDPLVQRFFDLTAERMLMPRAPMRFYLGTIGGTPIATSELTITGRVAGLYNVATLPPYRNRGVGTAMAKWALREAVVSGCFVGVSHALPEAAPLLRRIGFESFGEISEYKPAW